MNEELIQDLQCLRDQKPLSSIIYNQVESEAMVFIQTAEMLELYKRNSDSGVLIHILPHQENSKYPMSVILINGVDQTVGNILTFAIGYFSVESESTAFKWFLEKFNEKCSVLRKPIKLATCELNENLLHALKKKCSQAKVMISHHSIINEFKSIQADLLTNTNNSNQFQILNEIC